VTSEIYISFQAIIVILISNLSTDDFNRHYNTLFSTVYQRA